MARSNSKSLLFVFFLLLALGDVFVWRLVLFPHETAVLELDFLDVGQGDASLIRFPGGVDVLIDGGRDAKVLRSLSDVLPPEDRYIDLVVMTHPQLDHFGGLIDVMKNYEVGTFVGNGRTADIAAYQELERTLADRGVRYLTLGEGDRIIYGDSRFEVLAPSAKNLESKELNDTSLVMMLAAGNLRALYTGDIGLKGEDELVTKYDLDADVLKVPHHGSKFSSGNRFLAEVTPLVAAIGVGKNSYGHPTKETLGRLDAVRARTFRTDENGIVKLVVREGDLDIFTENPAH